ncbi:DeoR/GlpR family DNA-binding transcription regulator [Mycolicibacterium sp. 050158]|uniref:DeoR/GlpR family DNA-binding transcription regulator n=1 Tax=Mycolicibacterium sp. 050158 TaxID=3090602 RepID=UPI00299ED9A5|nr:DeoR/GlpR family DNA-binding transcription regulator [Mycolicibacterium sp. 050158]MDX1891713.1 DeoR/GlpR family DNA-binding transcription regulator [Mycolicibacterium sp. 050158]
MLLRRLSRVISPNFVKSRSTSRKVSHPVGNIARMFLARRHERILAALAGGGQSVVQLAESLGVSESTIRRDLDILAKGGQLERLYGGAMLTQGSRATITDSGAVEDPFTSDARGDLELRQRMAIEAARLVSDGDVVVLDIGSTTPLVARELRGRPVTIITSNLAVLDEVRGDDAVELVLLGGVLRRNQQSLVGPLAEQVIGQLSADRMFLSCTGVRGGRVLDNMAVEAPIKQALIAASQSIVLLASELKFPGSGALRLCSLDDVDVLITTAGTSEDELVHRREAGRKVIVA